MPPPPPAHNRITYYGPPISQETYHKLWPIHLPPNATHTMPPPPHTITNHKVCPTPPHTHIKHTMAHYTSQQTYHTFYPHHTPQRSKIYQPNLQQAVLSSTTWQNYYKQWPIHFQTRRPIHPPTPTPKLAANQRSICPSPNSPQMLAPPLPNKAPCTDLQGLPTQLTENNGPRPSPVHGKWILRHGDLCLVAGSLKMSSTGAASSSGTSGQVMATHWCSLILMCPSWCQICTMQKQALSNLVSLYSTLLSYLIICGRWAF